MVNQALTAKRRARDVLHGNQCVECPLVGSLLDLTIIFLANTVLMSTAGNLCA